MSSAENGPIVLYADQEHGGIRLVIFISLFVGFFLGFQILIWVLDALAPTALQDYSTFLACVGAVPLAVFLIWALEKWLKKVWHSGVSLALDTRGITVHDSRQLNKPDQRGGAGDDDVAQAPVITWGDNLSQLNWWFRLSGYPRGGRERRVPAKWFCLATELHQDGSRLNLYAFIPPEQASPWIENPQLDFQRLNPAEVYDTSARARIGPPSRPTIPNHLLHSKEGRYWLAERRRWEYGVELSAKDFFTLMDYARTGITGQPDPGASNNSQPDS